MAPHKLHATGLVPECLAAQVLDFMHEGRLGLRMLAAAAEVVAADCRFNDWVASDVKRAGLTDAEWFQLLEQTEQIHKRAAEAIKAFATYEDQTEIYTALMKVAALLNERSLPRRK